MAEAAHKKAERSETDNVAGPATNDSALARAVNDAASAAPDHQPSIMAIKVEVRFVLGRAEVEVGKLMDLSEKHVLLMDRGPSDPVDLMVNGTRIAQGELIEGEDGLGVRVTRICSPNPGRRAEDRDE